MSESSGTGPALIDFCTYATCWMFGMAHRDGSLKRVHKVLLGVLAVAALAGGAVWTKLHVPSLEIDEVPLSRGADLGGRGHPAAERVAARWRGWTGSPCCAGCWG